MTNSVNERIAILGENKTFIDVIIDILKAVKLNQDDENTVNEITWIAHRERKKFQEMFGFNINDFALAALKWLNTEISIKSYNEEILKLDNDSKYLVEMLVDKQVYKDV